MANESKKTNGKQTRKPNNPNKNEIVVTTNGNQVTLDPEVPAEQTVDVKVKIKTEQIDQELDLRFNGRAATQDIVYSTYPKEKNGVVSVYGDQVIEVMVDLNKSPLETGKTYTLEADTNIAANVKITKVQAKDDQGQLQDKNGHWLVEANDKTGKIKPFALTIKGDGYNDAQFKAEFKDVKTKPLIRYQIINVEDRAQVGKEFLLRTWYNTEKVECSSMDLDADVELIDVNTGTDVIDGETIGVVACTYKIKFKTEGEHEIELLNSEGDKRIITFDVFEIGVGEYMKLNKKKMEVKINEEKFIHCEVALKDDDIEIESEGIDNSAIEKRLEGNRIYIKGKVAGTYEVLVKSKRYNDSKFTVVVLNETYTQPTPPAPETFFDLGTLPTDIDTTDASLDDFVTKLVATSPADGNKAKVCWALNAKDFPPYALLTKMLCLANEGLLSDTAEARARGAKQLYSAFQSVVNEVDYIIFKQQMLLLKLVFEHYKDAGLKEDTILYNASDVIDFEFLSHMVKFVYADIENKLKGKFNIKGMSNVIDMRGKERILRYVHELV